MYFGLNLGCVKICNFSRMDGAGLASIRPAEAGPAKTILGPSNLSLNEENK